MLEQEEQATHNLHEHMPKSPHTSRQKCEMWHCLRWAFIRVRPKSVCMCASMQPCTHAHIHGWIHSYSYYLHECTTPHTGDQTCTPALYSLGINTHTHTHTHIRTTTNNNKQQQPQQKQQQTYPQTQSHSRIQTRARTHTGARTCILTACVDTLWRSSAPPSTATLADTCSLSLLLLLTTHSV